MDDLLKYEKLVYNIIGAAFEVHRELRGGLLEPVYQEALARELTDRGIECQREVELPVYYKGRLLDKKYRMDIVVKDIIIELKSVDEITSDHRAQLCNYLRLAKKPIGLLINFGRESLYGERWFFDEEENECYKLDKHMQQIAEQYDLYDL